MRLMGIPKGVQGVKETLKLMQQLVKSYKKHPAIRQAALDLTRGLLQKDYTGEVKALYDFVRDRIRYVRDIRGVETLSTPDKILEDAAGDCDDKAVLLDALLESLGHPTGFRAIGFKLGSFSHVMAITRIGAKWIPLETTEPVDLGWMPSKAVNVMDVYN